MTEKGSYGNVRSKKIAQELKEDILNGGYACGAKFLSREELAARFGISPVTAFRVLKLLEADGFLSCGRGRRATLLAGREASPEFCPARRLKIVLAAERTGGGVPDMGLEWLYTCLHNRLKNDGQQILPWDGKGEPPEGSGYLVLLEKEKAPDLYWTLRNREKPFCMLSSRLPSENTAFFLTQMSLTQMSLYFAARHVRTIRILRGFDSPFDRMMTPKAESILPPDYGIRFQEEEPFSLRDEKSVLRLRNILREQRDKRDSAVFCTNQILSERIWEEACSMGYREAVMTGLHQIAGPPLPYSAIRMDLAGFSRSLLAMLYRQFRTGRTHDPGILLQPEFQECGIAEMFARRG